jgi:broad specificity phosphatase PhoE
MVMPPLTGVATSLTTALTNRADRLTRPVVHRLLCCRGRKVVAVRHAEVAGGGSDPILTVAGQARAQTLVHLFEAEPPATILVSEFTRTQQTAAPVAAAHGLTPVVVGAGLVPSAHVDALVAAVNAAPLWSTVLVVGHSNTVPALVGRLTGATLADIAPTEFDRLYVALGRRRLELRYGTPT